MSLFPGLEPREPSTRNQAVTRPSCRLNIYSSPSLEQLPLPSQIPFISIIKAKVLATSASHRVGISRSSSFGRGLNVSSVHNWDLPINLLPFVGVVFLPPRTVGVKPVSHGCNSPEPIVSNTVESRTHPFKPRDERC